jgi:hypothetical protein
MSDHKDNDLDVQDAAPNVAAAPGAAAAPVPGIKPPSSLLIDNNMLENWKLFKQKWNIYSVISKLERQPVAYQVALLLHTLGDATLRVCNGNSTSTEKRRHLELVLNSTRSLPESQEFGDFYHRPGLLRSLKGTHLGE